jgi:hypothetical protein
LSHRFFGFGIILVLAAALGPPARADGEARPLGRLEQESVDQERATLGLAIDPHPEGKTIGRIYVVNEEVFSRRDWWFQFFNIFHRTTRENALRRELLVKPGTPYDQALVDETVRNLQVPPALTIGGRSVDAPELSSVVAIVPIVSPVAGQIDLLVVTRDVWSLRFNTDFDFQQNKLALLDTSLSENNLFGWRKFLSFGYTLNLGAYGFGPTYFDPNIHGTHLTLYTSAVAWYARDTGHYEGDREIVSLRYPLYSLASQWGGGVDFIHQNLVQRAYQGAGLQQICLADAASRMGMPCPGDQQFPYIYRYDDLTVDSSVVRSFGTYVIQRVTAGHLFDARTRSVLPDFAGDAAQAAQFLSLVAPDAERRSEPYLRYDVFTAHYEIFRDLETFDLRENRRLGPSLSLRLSYGLPALGADFTSLGLSGAVGWAGAWRGGVVDGTVKAGGRLREGKLIDQSVSGEVFAASPILGRALRLVVDGQGAAVRDDTRKTFYYVGGQTGLRGYAIGELVGTAELIGHVELRTLALPVFSQRFGVLGFYDVGGAAPSWRAVVPYHDVGGGLRWLIPQLNSSVVRIDWAFALQNTIYTRAGAPGRVTAGFEQAF